MFLVQHGGAAVYFFKNTYVIRAGISGHSHPPMTRDASKDRIAPNPVKLPRRNFDAEAAHCTIAVFHIADPQIPSILAQGAVLTILYRSPTANISRKCCVT